MEMIFCPRCGTRFDPELIYCPVCKAEVVPPKPTEVVKRKPELPSAPSLTPALPVPTVHIVERPAVEGVMTGAVWSDVILGLLGGLLLPSLVGWSVFSAMSETQIPYLLGFLLLALPVGLEIALFVHLLGRYRSLAVGLGVSAGLCLLVLCGVGLLFLGSNFFMSGFLRR